MRGSGWARVAARRRPVLGAGGSRVSAGARSPKPGSPGEADSRSCWLCAWRTAGAFGLPPGGAAGLRGRVGAIRRVPRMSNPSAFGLNAGSGLGCRRVCRWGGGGPWWEVQFASGAGGPGCHERHVPSGARAVRAAGRPRSAALARVHPRLPVEEGGRIVQPGWLLLRPTSLKCRCIPSSVPSVDALHPRRGSWAVLGLGAGFS